SKPGVDDQYYTQLNMVKTIEQILGVRPMNQEDGAAQPMYSAFTNRPDFSPFDVQPNQIPLTRSSGTGGGCQCAGEGGIQAPACAGRRSGEHEERVRRLAEL